MENDAPSPAEERPEDIVSPAHLEMLAQVSGFRFEPDPTLPLGRTGYTNKETRVIHYNPLKIRRGPPITVETDQGPIEVAPLPRPEGFFYHEAGHHVKDVLDFDNRLIALLGDPSIVPEAYKTSPAAQARFFEALYSHLVNALVDIWLESFMGRRPYYPVRDAITEYQQGKGEANDFRGLSKPDQLIQALLQSRYFALTNIEERLDPDVCAAYRAVHESGAMRALLDRSVFESYFSSDAEKERAIQRKVDAYKSVCLPEYLKLMEKELEERRNSEMQTRAGRTPGGSAVPLTDEEMRQIVDEFLTELIKAGEEFRPLAPAADEETNRERRFRRIRQYFEERERDRNAKPLLPPSEPDRLRGEEAIRLLAEELMRKARERMYRGLAEGMQVSERSIQRWERIRERYRAEIQSTGAALADVFLDDRRRRIDYLRREGDIIPGLEYETIAALSSGDPDPKTRMTTVRNPEFLETELEFIIDTSGSMAGTPITRTVDLLVVVAEAFRTVKEDLAGENLLRDDEEPLRIGVTKYAKLPERVTKLTEPLSDRKEALIIEHVSKTGGGTDETQAVGDVHRALTLGRQRVIKIIVHITDGYGNEAGIAPILRQIEDDKQVIYLEVFIAQTHEQAEERKRLFQRFIKEREGNVEFFATTNVETVLPHALEVLKREVDKRRQF